MSKMISCHPMNLVGIAERIREIESVLEMESQEVRIVGIWGMGGIGKTTIAGAVYNKICTEFEASLFVANIREELKRCTVVDLQRRFVSRLLDQEIPDMGPLRFGNHLIKDGLRHKKVLIVFDDVDSSMPLQELLLGQHDSFGPGSRILITSRDRHVLEQVVDATYGVHALNHIESLQLLKSKAFKKFDPTSDHQDLLERVVNYAKGNPLALVVLGSALCDRSKEDWFSKLNGLGQGQDVDILKVLRISYDGLTEEEKNIFLDIAYFFRGMDRCRVTLILETKSSSVHYCISVLIEKSLMTDFGNILGMHDLLLEMAYSIVNEGSKNPRKRRWLVDHEEIYEVLKKRKGREAVKGICLDMPASSKMRLKSDDFEGMRGLEFLIIKGNTSKVKLPRRGLQCLPKKLRYFRWDGYPSRSLPQKFCAANLVEFDFCGSEVEELWSGGQKLVNLRRIDLSCSRRLTKLPDLSEAKKLKYLFLKGCSSLIEVPSSIQFLKSLVSLCLIYCKKLSSLPSSIRFLTNLVTLNLTDCKKLTSLPNIIGELKSLKHLYLSGTAITSLPSSIQFLTNLKNLELIGTAITSLPSSIRFLTNLEYLKLSGTAITSLPSSIQFLTNLIRLHLTNCKKLSSLPNSICELKSLEELSLSGTAIRELPELPPSLERLSANDCESLEIISSITVRDPICELYFANCFKLDGKALMEDVQLKIQSRKMADRFAMLLPGSEIPQWFGYQSRGSSITIRIPSNPTNLKAFAFCSVAHMYNSKLSLEISESYHMYLNYRNISNYRKSECLGHEVSFETPQVKAGVEWESVEVKMCGVHLIYYKVKMV